MKVAFTLFFVLVSFNIVLGQSTDSRKWQLIEEENGVAFYIHVMEMNGEADRTFVKIINSTEAKIRLNFSTIFPCTESLTKKQYESVGISPNGIVIYSYEVCKLNLQERFSISEISIIPQ